MVIRELNKLWNMRVTVIPNVIGALGMVLKGLERRFEELEIEGQIKTIETIASLTSNRKLRRVLEIWEDLSSLRLEWKTNNNNNNNNNNNKAD